MKRIIVIVGLSFLTATSSAIARGWDYDPVAEAFGNFARSQPDAKVRDLQRKLTEQGYYRGALDGVENPAFKKAVWNFQRDKNLMPSGALDAPTVTAIETAGSAGAASPATR